MGNTWYTGYYGSWRNNTFARLDGTYDKKEIIARAQKIADEKNLEVTILSETPTGYGLSSTHFKVMPQKEGYGKGITTTSSN